MSYGDFPRSGWRRDICERRNGNADVFSRANEWQPSQRMGIYRRQSCVHWPDWMDKGCNRGDDPHHGVLVERCRGWRVHYLSVDWAGVNLAGNGYWI